MLVAAARLFGIWLGVVSFGRHTLVAAAWILGSWLGVASLGRHIMLVVPKLTW